MVSQFHHVGCLVGNIDAAIADYLILHPSASVSPVYEIPEQQVRVCFFGMGAFHIEFVEPASEQSPLYSLLRKNLGFYHIALYMDDLTAEIARLEAAGYKLASEFRSPAFNDRHCAFLHNNEMHLIELIETEQ